ncbi:MAG TPA: TadE family type IV pilus minor pilin [Acidimicrobiia bacterium]|nr:TadE family type IV pilus minor pilin [Acidimicrobiia bacterium]
MSRDRGSAAVEFALVLPVVLLVLLAAVEVAVAARVQLEVSSAAREGAREAATSPEPERAVAAVRRALGGETGSRARVSVAREHRVGGTAEVVVRLRHRVAAPLFGGFDVTLVARAVMRVEQ